MSLKQTAHLRAQSEVPAFLRSSNANTTAKEPPPNSGLPFHQRSNSENGTNYVSYSPYALRRKELIRPFSPPTPKDATTDSEGPNLPPRPFSPYRQHEQTARDYPANRCSTNGQGRQETARPFSPYRQQEGNNLVDGNSRSYSPYRGRYDERDANGGKDRWQGVSRSLSPFARDYSPWRRENVDPPGVIQPPPPSSCDSGRYSPFLQQRLAQPPPLAPQTHPPQMQNIYGSPMISRKR